MDEYGFEARLRHLEHILAGQQATHLERATQQSLSRRIDALRKELQTVYHNSKSINDFITKYNTHAKLLNPNNSILELEREILAPGTKLELVLAAQDDLEKFATEVKQIKALESVVSGAEYNAVEKLGPELAPLEVAHAEQLKQLTDVTQRVSTLMENYNGVINTLSEIFISWDDILATMESHMSALEREKGISQT
ncbi:hypothetical protein DFQ28_002792 [Apophysomyces sp. BC1034]|nr:hypothetical protein DFQ30_003128 [Apophysomyces sp. BC1015]KAG0179479.1 hypothetical protein DFQ29_002064 [Apophysomyces sp. BC1021]KAG0189875.1 hypothetical protein DFQ28_002792 [Apophysomyces sp. BC1034]